MQRKLNKAVLVFLSFAILGSASGETGQRELKRDGMSLETAVIIQVERQSDGPAAEWAWIEKHLPGAKRPEAKPEITDEDGEEIVSMAHSLLIENGKTYSSLLVSLPNGTERVVYFDITSCFGK